MIFDLVAEQLTSTLGLVTCFYLAQTVIRLVMVIKNTTHLRVAHLKMPRRHLHSHMVMGLLYLANSTPTLLLLEA